MFRHFWSIILLYTYATSYFLHDELRELKDSYNSAPLMNITYSAIRIPNKKALFGGYKGLQGVHKYKKFDYLFSGTCESDKNYDVYCPSESDEEEDLKVDKGTCVDYYEIKSFSYDFLKDRYNR